MAINFNREQKRYEATVTANKALHAELETVKGKIEALKGDLDQLQADATAYTEKSEEMKALIAQHLHLASDARLGVEAAQKAALERQQTRYPAALKRHLIKCRKHGWTDARLTTTK